MSHTTSTLAAVALSTALALGAAPAAAGMDGSAGADGRYSPGAPGIGDPYFPLDGNGGYDVEHYDLDLRYDPATDVLTGVATIGAVATQGLSSFNLDLEGLEVRAVSVDGAGAGWTRDGGELTVTPERGLRDGGAFEVEVAYDGVPAPMEDELLGLTGFLSTGDGALVVGQPDVAATWFPANDHPADAASFTVAVTVPEGLEAVSNGVLESEETSAGWTTWTWHAEEPMAPYLATMAVGELEVDAYEADGVRYWDAIDPALLAPRVEPRSGEQFAVSLGAASSYERLTRTVGVPSDGAQLSFWVTRDTEPDFDVLVVEARAAGTEEWTTLPDLGGRTTQDTSACLPLLAAHPFLDRYLTPPEDDGAELAEGEEPAACTPAGSSGQWWAASGASEGYEQWAVDLGAYAGGDVEISVSQLTDDSVQLTGVVVDDVETSTGEGSTSFEDDGDDLDGWAVTGPPEGSAPATSAWLVGTAADGPATRGEVAREAFARQPEVIAFLTDRLGPYPFTASGGIVDDVDDLAFSLETQTRPVYASAVFDDEFAAETTVVHELSHQWFGDSLRLGAWQHIWLNEGFATYAEWLWAEREGLETAQDAFDLRAAFLTADDPFWQVPIGDPGPDALLGDAVYERGAMTLHALRLEIGDDDFFELLGEWASSQAGGTVTTDEFTDLAEEVSGAELDEFFTTWLLTPERPADLPEG